MGCIIATVNQKGGVAKTTTVANVAAALSRRRPRPRVLVVDLDAQGHAAKALGAPRESGGDVASVLWDGVPTAEAIRHEPRLPGVDVLAGATRMAEFDIAFADDPSRHRLVEEMLRPVRDDYDLILLDLPPGFGLAQLGAYVAADRVLVPLAAEADAVAGLVDLRANLERARTHLDARARLLGILVTMYEGHTLEHSANAREIERRLGDAVLATRIRKTTRVREAARERLTVVEYAPEATAARDYVAATEEIVRRIEED